MDIIAQIFAKFRLKQEKEVEFWEMSKLIGQEFTNLKQQSQIQQKDSPRPN